MYVICGGMPRSGSTWQYNVACHILRKYGRPDCLGIQDFDQFLASAGDTKQRDKWRIMKIHDYHPIFARKFPGVRIAVLYSYRDIRDVAFSLVHLTGKSFEENFVRQSGLQTILANDSCWRAHPAALCQRYEDVVTNPAAAVQAIADHLECSISCAEAHAIADQFSLSAMRKRVAAFVKRVEESGVDTQDMRNRSVTDPHSLLHWNHFREGKVGSWQELATPRQIASLALACGYWLIENGYEQDLAWAMPALESHIQHTQTETIACAKSRFPKAFILKHNWPTLYRIGRMLKNLVLAITRWRSLLPYPRLQQPSLPPFDGGIPQPEPRSQPLEEALSHG